MPDHGEASHRREGGAYRAISHAPSGASSVGTLRLFLSFPRRRHVRERAAQRQSYRTAAETRLTTSSVRPPHVAGRRGRPRRANVPVDSNQLAQDTQRNQRRGAGGGNHQHRMELWINLLAEATGQRP